MAACRLRVSLGKRVYHGSGRIKGRVRARPDGPATCRRLTVSLVASIHRQDTGQAYETVWGEPVLVCQAVQWPAGEEWTGRFEVPAPTEPVRFHDAPHFVAWKVVAEADIEGLGPLRAEARVTFHLTPEESRSLRQYAELVGPAPEGIRGVADPRGFGHRKVALALGLGTFVPVAFFLGWIWMADPDTRAMGLGAFATGGLLASWVVGHLVLVPWLRRKASEALGDPELSVEPDLVFPGREITVSVTLRPQEPLRLVTAEAVVEAVERRLVGTSPSESLSGRGGAYLETKKLLRDELEPVQVARFLAAGREHTLVWRYRIPERARPTRIWTGSQGRRKGVHVRVEWAVQVRLRAAGRLPWRGRYWFAVLPKELA